MNSLPEKMWRIKGAKSGPTVTILGGTHGDELAGVAIIQRLLKQMGIDSAQTSVERDDVSGVLYFGFGNPEAIKLKKRGVSDERDLNRAFIPRLLEADPLPDDVPDVVRARELAPILRTTDILLDLHATSSPAPAFIGIDEYTAGHRDIARFIPVEYVVSDPTELYHTEAIDGVPGTTDFFVDTFSTGTWCRDRYRSAHGVGLCFETGHEKDVSKVDEAYTAVVRVLMQVGLASDAFIKILGNDPDQLRSLPEFTPQHYEISICKQVEGAGFRYAPGMGQGWQKVVAGTELGRYADGTPVTIPEDGMLVFPVAERKAVPGRILYCIARPAK